MNSETENTGNFENDPQEEAPPEPVPFWRLGRRGLREYANRSARFLEVRSGMCVCERRLVPVEAISALTRGVSRRERRARKP